MTLSLAGEQRRGWCRPPDEGAQTWLVDLCASEEEYGRACTLLSDVELARARAMRGEAARRRFVLARAALRTRLGHALSLAPERVALSLGEHGKPELATPLCYAGVAPARGSLGLPRFNLSHGDGVALLAIHPSEAVGVDIEQIAPARHPWARLLERICHPQEAREALAEARTIGPRAFYERWVGKEAVLKALGHGLRVSPADVSLRRDAGGVLRVSKLWGRASSEGRCRLDAVPAPSAFVAAVALLEASD